MNALIRLLVLRGKEATEDEMGGVYLLETQYPEYDEQIWDCYQTWFLDPWQGWFCK